MDDTGCAGIRAAAVVTEPHEEQREIVEQGEAYPPHTVKLARSHIEKGRAIMAGPSDAVILERALSFCREACATVRLQHRRVRGSEPEDAAFPFRREADIHFMIVTLLRVRRAAELAARVPGLPHSIPDAIAEFDDRLPDLKKMRNAGQHIDEYALDKGHDKSVLRSQLQVNTWDGTVFRWLGAALDIDVALHASEALLATVSQCVSPSSPVR
ncbi:hypothetical protein F3J20_13350 [Paraburkholderia sp. Cy-641]|uniref:hypothetical protein n=1 Tax=Paraburkholderia sp. Cy-641 TaxID=2608337 RepID=UPI00141ED27B|nr:hypothetical protein [Paraburkholderia sp. Cy-641]NIF78361.1 hypothetical protein [Paraburkholderia sp. Cy-641]